MFLVTCSLKHTHTLARLKLYFQNLLTHKQWLVEKFALLNPGSRIGVGIGQWLLNCTKDRFLTVFSLVIPQKLTTSIYDHLAWGLIGLYKRHQEQTVYRRVDIGNIEDHAQLKVVEKRSLQSNDSYRLLFLDEVIRVVKNISPVHLYPFIS